MEQTFKYGKRDIIITNEYDKYFPKCDNINTEVGNNDIEYNVDKLIPSIVEKCKHQTKKIADFLYHSDLETFCRNIWHFLFKHIQYEYDEAGVEQFRSPARSWADREAGIDCDCFSIFVSCILSNKGIPHYFRITKYNNSERWQHIYVIVPKGTDFDRSDSLTYYTIDCVIHAFDTEKEYTNEHIYFMETNNGLGIITEFLSGLDDRTEIDYNEKFNNLLLNGFDEDELGGIDTIQKITRLIQCKQDAVRQSPQLFRLEGGVPAIFEQQCDLALQALKTSENEAEKALYELSETEIESNFNHGGKVYFWQLMYKLSVVYGLLGLDDDDADERLEQVLDGLEDDMDVMYDTELNAIYGLDDDDEINGLGKASKAKKKEIRKQTRKEIKAERKERKQEHKAAKAAIKADTTLSKKEKRKALRKQNAKRAKQVIGTVALAPARLIVALLIKSNFKKWATQAMPYFLTEAQCKQYGYDRKKAEQVYNKLKKVFVDDMSGTKAKLKSCIQIGALKKGMELSGVENVEIDGLGAILSTAIISSACSTAAGFIIKIMKSMADKNAKVDGLSGGEGIDWAAILEQVKNFLKKLFKKKETLAEANNAESGVVPQNAIQRFISNAKERIAENKAIKEATKGMSKQEAKEYKKKAKAENKKKREEKRAAEKAERKEARTERINEIKDNFNEAVTDIVNDKIFGGSNDEYSGYNTTETKTNMGNQTSNVETQESFWQKHKTKILVGGGILLAGGITAGILIHNKNKKKNNTPESTLQGIRKLRPRRTATKIVRPTRTLREYGELGAMKRRTSVLPKRRTANCATIASRAKSKGNTINVTI